MKKEIWKPILGYEGIYEVSSFGRIKSLKRRSKEDKNERGLILKQKKTKAGYYIISLHNQGKEKFFFVHRLVAQAFIPNPENLPIINHIDENKSNNCVENLEWCDQCYNINYGTCIERATKTRIANYEKNKPSYQRAVEKLKATGHYKRCREKSLLARIRRVARTTYDGCILETFDSIQSASDKYHIHHSNIIACCNGKRRLAGGFRWIYI